MLSVAIYCEHSIFRIVEQKSRVLVGLRRADPQYPESLLSFSLDAVGIGNSMRSRSFIFWVLLLVDVSPSGYVKTNEEENMPQIEKYSDMNVFVAVGDGVKTLIVMEGDSVTLNTNLTEIKRYDTILWMFGDEYIAKMNEAAGIFFISEGGRFRNRLALDNQTGSLTIKNIRTEHTGDYQLQIRSKSETTKKFNVTVRDLPEKSHWNITGPVLAVMLVVILMIMFVICLMIKMGKIKVSWCHKNEDTEDTTQRQYPNHTENTSSLLNP